MFQKIGSSLDQLKQALNGVILMTDDLDEMAQSLLNNRLPSLWLNHCYKTLKPLASWLEDLQLRKNAISNWIEKGLPPVYWLALYFFPQGFLTSILQNHARKIKWPIDKINFKFAVVSHVSSESSKAGAADGCYVSGLYAEGF